MSAYKMTSHEVSTLTGDQRELLSTLSTFAKSGNLASGIASHLPEIKSALSRNSALAKPFLEMAETLGKNPDQSPLVASLSRAVAEHGSTAKIRVQAAKDMIKAAATIPDAGKSIAYILDAPRHARGNNEVKRLAAAEASKWLNSPQLGNPEKKVGYAMQIAAFARDAGKIDHVQDKASAAILNAAPGLHNSGKRHAALNFALRHATTSETRNRAMGMVGHAPQAEAAPGAVPNAPTPARRQAPNPVLGLN